MTTTLTETLTDRLWKEAYRYMGDPVSRILKEAARDREAQSELYGAACRGLNYVENSEKELGATIDCGDALRAAIARARKAEAAA
jgi:hypothetical protein